MTDGPEPVWSSGHRPRRSWGWVVLGGLAVFLMACVLGTAAAVLYFRSQVPSFDSLSDYDPPRNTVVLGADGAIVAEIPGERLDGESVGGAGDEATGPERGQVERRTVVSYDRIPAVVIQALISAEDARFFEHRGIDYWGIAKAALQNLRPGARTRGASTLTQQVAKQIVGSERTLARKIKEAILARRLEQNLSKEQILHVYLNEIYVGHRRYGIEEASKFYFGHGIADVTLAEAAVLASIPKDPNGLDPRRNPARVKERQAYVLRRMSEQGHITAAQAEATIGAPIKVAPPPTDPAGAYYVEEVRRVIAERLGDDALRRGGLVVRTAMDPVLQDAAEKALKQGLRDVDKRQGFRGPLGQASASAWTMLVDGARKARQRLVDQRGAVSGPDGGPADGAGDTPVLDVRRASFDVLARENPSPDDMQEQVRRAIWRPLTVDVETVGRVESVTRASAVVDLGGLRGTIPLSASTWARRANPRSATPAPKSLADVLHPGDLVLVRVTDDRPCGGRGGENAGACPPDGASVAVALEQLPRVEGALVSIDPGSREVVALVGGYDWRRSSFNRATQAHRQPGSAFKPFVYAAALDQGQRRGIARRDWSATAAFPCVVFHPRQTVFDTPEVIRDRWTGKPWQPRNFERDGFAGELTLRQALAESKNTVAVKLLSDIGCDPLQPDLDADARQDLGLRRVQEVARQAGIDSPIPESLTAALGSAEVVPLELVNSYATIAADGVYAAPVVVRRVEDPSTGEVLFESSPAFQRPPTLPVPVIEAPPRIEAAADAVPPAEAAPSDDPAPPEAADSAETAMPAVPPLAEPRPPDQPTDAATNGQPGPVIRESDDARGWRPELAFVTRQLMRSVVEDPNGTARSLRKLGRPVAGKTGTASEHRDAWFVGVTPEFVTGVWVGFDDHAELGPRETGGHAAAPAWLAYMQEAEKTRPPADWSPPPGVVSARVDPRTGLLAPQDQPDAEDEWFLDATQPSEHAPRADEAAPDDLLRGPDL